MKNIRFFLSENFQFLEVKFSIYLNRHVFVMRATSAVSAVIVSVVFRVLSLRLILTLLPWTWNDPVIVAFALRVT